MKKVLLVVLMLFTFSVNAAYVTQITESDDINAFNISTLMDYPAAVPIFGLISAGGNPLTETIIPLNFDLATGKPVPVSSSPITVTMNAPELGGGYVLSTGVGFGIIPTPYFEPVFFDSNDWHTATKTDITGDRSLSFLFDPHPVLDPVSSMQIGGNQAGLLMADVTAAVPVPAAAWLFGSGLIGMVGLGRRKG